MLALSFCSDSRDIPFGFGGKLSEPRLQLLSVVYDNMPLVSFQEEKARETERERVGEREREWERGRERERDGEREREREGKREGERKGERGGERGREMEARRDLEEVS